MTRKCELTGIGPVSGNNVSHAQNRTKTRFLPNLNNVSLMSESLGMRLRFRASASALRSVEHRGGIDSFLLKASDSQLSKKALRYKKLLLKAG